jgi:hypothetical protein
MFLYGEIFFASEENKTQSFSLLASIPQAN